MAQATPLRSVEQPTDGGTADPIGASVADVTAAAQQLHSVDQKESSGIATIARIDFVAAETCQQLEALIAEAGEFKQLVLQDAAQVKLAIDLLVESGKAASEHARQGKQVLTDLRSRRAKLVKGA